MRAALLLGVSVLAAFAVAPADARTARRSTHQLPAPPPAPAPAPAPDPEPLPPPPPITDTTNYSFGYSSAWLGQIGVSNTILQQAWGGQGMTIGFVDTGVVATQADVAGRVSPLSSCAAVTFVCSNGFTDDNGHGTSTAAIGAGATYGTNKGMSGVAPRATILEEKVLNASGSGYASDVANGIIKAADGGANVISLSLTYYPDSSVVKAINYATAKGAVVVFAGGNSSAPLNSNANGLGFTPTSLTHLVFVGSVNASNAHSSFSNTPGTGSAVSGTTSVPYKQLWLDAPGENIVAPAIQYGATGFGYWTGTSMATPMVGGALALLEKTWPILATNGTAAQVLFQSATDLGASGVDTTYGWGLLNVTRAFQPIGTLSVDTGSTLTPVTSLRPTRLRRGALGSLSDVAPVLANTTAFDAFTRNFTVDLSSLVSETAGHTAALNMALAPAVLNGTQHLSSGATMTFAYAADALMPRASIPGADGLREAEAGVPLYRGATGQWMMSISGAASEITVGHGFSASASFAQSLWGSESGAADAAYALQGTANLMDIASGGHFLSAGFHSGETTRFGVAFAQSGLPDYTTPAAGALVPRASAISAGVMTELVPGWTGGAMVSVLDEQNGLLGETYTPGGVLDFGANHKSASLALSSAFDIGESTSLFLTAAVARSDGAAVNGLVTGVSPMLARSFGASLVEKSLFTDSDRLTLSVSKPLRVFDGSFGIATTSVDSFGNPQTGVTRVPIRPDGNETDMAIGYAKYWGDANVGGSLLYRTDADSVRAMDDFVARIGGSVQF